MITYVKLLWTQGNQGNPGDAHCRLETQKRYEITTMCTIGSFLSAIEIGNKLFISQTSRHKLFIIQTSRHKIFIIQTSRHKIIIIQTSRHKLFIFQTSRHKNHFSWKQCVEYVCASALHGRSICFDGIIESLEIGGISTPTSEASVQEFYPTQDSFPDYRIFVTPPLPHTLENASSLSLGGHQDGNEQLLHSTLQCTHLQPLERFTPAFTSQGAPATEPGLHVSGARGETNSMGWNRTAQQGGGFYFGGYSGWYCGNDNISINSNTAVVTAFQVAYRTSVRDSWCPCHSWQRRSWTDLGVRKAWSWWTKVLL